MQFEVVVEPFGGKSQPYSNNPATDLECILNRIKEFKSTGNQRHVVFVGESHNNQYDTGRRALLISEIRDKGHTHFPGGVPLIVAERFPEVSRDDVYMKEPELAEDLPKPFQKLRKHSMEHDEKRATGVISESEKMSGKSSPASQSRNQWLAYAIMETIKNSWTQPVPIIVVCGDDHKDFVPEALEDLAKSGYSSSAEVVWHHFPSAPDTNQPMVLGGFNFNLQGKTPAGFINGRGKDAYLILLSEGNLPLPFGVKLETNYGFHGEGWALFYQDDELATQKRNKLFSDGPYTLALTPEHPVLVQKLNGPKDITQAWIEAFE